MGNWLRIAVKKRTKERIKGEVKEELIRVRPHLKHMSLSYDYIINEVFDSWLRL